MQLSSSSTLRATAVTPVAGVPAFAPAKGIDAGSFLQVLAAWLWLPQAALLAWAVQQLAQGASPIPDYIQAASWQARFASGSHAMEMI